MPIRIESLKLSPIAIFAACLTVGSLPCPGQGAAAVKKVPTLDEYRAFAMVHDGDVAHGQRLFADEQGLACTKCHTIDGKGSKAGPDLFSVSDRFARRDIIQSVLTPSATIAVGYGTTLVETKSGTEFQGILKQSTGTAIELALADGQRVRIATTDIKEQRGSSVSLMPEGLQARLSLQDFADLIEYLVTLKEPVRSTRHERGMPDSIPALAHPATLRPFVDHDLRAPQSPAAAPGAIQSGLVWFGQVPGHPGRFLVVNQTGMIWLLEKDLAGDKISEFANFTPSTFSARGPNGLLGLAFHPQFQKNRKYYLKHQVFEDGKITTLLSERQFGADFRSDSGQEPRRLLKIPSVAEHHNGGCIEFGPDGFLYLGMGDSAPNFDPQGHGQDLRLLFGKMLRIDVDRRDPGLEYAIPSGNPFVGKPDARPEIWAYGLREPWRFSFDRVTGDLWVADLGQERGDEVDLVRRGENYGWNVYEGFELFSTQHRRDGAVYMPPIFSTHRKDGSAMVGGRVYRGDRHSSFYGVYIFGDHLSKRIWGLTRDHRALKSIRHIATSPQQITCITADEKGNLYVVGYQGMVYQLDLSGSRFDEPVSSSQTHAAR